LLAVGLHTCTAVARSLCVSWAFLLPLADKLTFLMMMMMMMRMMMVRQTIALLTHAGVAGRTCQASPCRGSRSSLSIFSAQQYSTRCSSWCCSCHCGISSTSTRPGSLPSGWTSAPLVHDWLCSLTVFSVDFSMLLPSLYVVHNKNV